PCLPRPSAGDGRVRTGVPGRRIRALQSDRQSTAGADPAHGPTGAVLVHPDAAQRRNDQQLLAGAGAAAYAFHLDWSSVAAQSVARRRDLAGPVAARPQALATDSSARMGGIAHGGFARVSGHLDLVILGYSVLVRGYGHRSAD